MQVAREEQAPSFLVSGFVPDSFNFQDLIICWFEAESISERKIRMVDGPSPTKYNESNTILGGAPNNSMSYHNHEGLDSKTSNHERMRSITTPKAIGMMR